MWFLAQGVFLELVLDGRSPGLGGRVLLLPCVRLLTQAPRLSVGSSVGSVCVAGVLAATSPLPPGLLPAVVLVLGACVWGGAQGCCPGSCWGYGGTGLWGPGLVRPRCLPV